MVVDQDFPASFVWKARLTSSVFLNPSPPKILGWHILSHVIIGSLCSLFDSFQKKFLLTRSNNVVVFFSDSKHCIVWDGNDSRLAWINTVLPALDSVFAFQDSILVVAFPRISEKSDALGLPWKTWQPRYLPRELLCGILKTDAIICFWACNAFLETTIEDLWKLITCLESWQKWSIIDFNLVQEEVLASKNKMLSSVKKRHGMIGEWAESEIPIPDLRVFTKLHEATQKAFMHKMNK